MTAKNRFSAFLRGYCSVLDLHPTASRKAYRDSIVDAQANGLYDIWWQVGEQIRDAQDELSKTDGQKRKLLDLHSPPILVKETVQ